MLMQTERLVKLKCICTSIYGTARSDARLALLNAILARLAPIADWWGLKFVPTMHLTTAREIVTHDSLAYPSHTVIVLQSALIIRTANLVEAFFHHLRTSVDLQINRTNHRVCYQTSKQVGHYRSG